MYLTVVDIIPETPQSKTLVLRSSEALSYQAGQFLTLLFNRSGHEVRRSYSMSSAPGIDTELSITVKRRPNGEVSRYLLDHVRVGDQLESLEPSGRFVLEPPTEQPRDVVMIAAGSGITPLYAMLKTSLKQDPLSRVVLLYSSRSRADTIFFGQLEQLEAQYPHQLIVCHLWSSEGQRLNNFVLEQLLRQYLRHAPERALFYLCGPPDLMRTAQITLKFMGFEREQIKKEHFVIDEPPASTVPTLPTAAELTLHFKNQTHQISIAPHQTVLDAALAAGIRLPYSCRGGRCSACAGRCTRGQVLMSVNDVLTDRDTTQGYILTCTAYPQTPQLEVWVG